MTSSNTERELDELLAESSQEAGRRAERVFSSGEGDALILYGAGTIGRAVLAKLRAAGVEPAAFADDTPEKRGTLVDGVEVMTTEEAASRFGDRAVFVVTILNPKLRFAEARRRLQTLTRARVVSFLHLAWKYPDSFLPYYQFILPQELLGSRQDIRRAFRIFDDEESRRQFTAHIRFRLRLEHEALPRNSRAAYFPHDVPLGLGSDATFVDCGAYDGDSIRGFLEHTGGRFGGIYAFEPDAANCERLRRYVASLDPHATERIRVLNAGAGSTRSKLRFNSTGDMSASFGGGDAATEVEVLPLDEVVETEDGPLYLKFDVEGAEWEALDGARRLIARPQTRLAVSVYHRPADLWLLPLRMNEMSPHSRLFLRTEGEDGMDVICYAVPRADG